MGVQKSRKSIKYTKYSLRRSLKEQNNIYVAKLYLIYKHYKGRKNAVFVIVNQKNMQNLFF